MVPEMLILLPDPPHHHHSTPLFPSVCLDHQVQKDRKKFDRDAARFSDGWHQETRRHGYRSKNSGELQGNERQTPTDRKGKWSCLSSCDVITRIIPPRHHPSLNHRKLFERPRSELWMTTRGDESNPTTLAYLILSDFILLSSPSPHPPSSPDLNFPPCFNMDMMLRSRVVHVHQNLFLSPLLIHRTGNNTTPNSLYLPWSSSWFTKVQIGVFRSWYTSRLVIIWGWGK